MIRDADWLWPTLGMKIGGRSLLPMWFMGDTVHGKTRIFRYVNLRFLRYATTHFLRNS